LKEKEPGTDVIFWDGSVLYRETQTPNPCALFKRILSILFKIRILWSMEFDKLLGIYEKKEAKIY